jgi:hypothetical protein
MEIQLNLDPAEIAKKLTESLTNQAFTELFKKSVEEELKVITSSNWNNGDSVMRRAVRSFLEAQMYKVLNEEYTEVAKNIIRKKFDENKLAELAEKFVERIKLSDY